VPSAGDVSVSDSVLSVSDLSIYNPSDLAVMLIDNIHVACDVPYWQAIILSTVAFRFALLPFGVVALQQGSRRVEVTPQLEKMKSKLDMTSIKDNTFYARESKALYKKHNFSPMLSIVAGLIQIPPMIAFFMGLRKMGEYCPDYCTGGPLWLTDLSAADPYYVLPTASAVSMFLMFELNADGMRPSDPRFVMGMRALSLAMIPISSQFSSGLLIYWIANNALTVTQSLVLRTETLSKMLDIRKPPKTVPLPLFKTNPITNIIQVITQKESPVEVIQADGTKKTVSKAAAPTSPPPNTYAFNPTKKPKKKKVAK